MKPITQSRLEGFIEASLNTASGFIISLFVWNYVIAPVFNIATTGTQAFEIATIFTVISIARSYVWRRYFNKRLHNKIHRLLSE